ncbi:ubiquinol-cytochrome c reductase iron-sulfur subunit [Sulfuriferula plumbiphila]|uniref:Ubiquinol-cytochrome c reductase iron-sulfur subunit n=2 Tax=Sulfuriferula plumbiphila TaxID=171865 RepID=A0A512L970_9PROT|nr:ubiquinol-cytochrome c reductase iron-sulfur subunit [Sulfuriferula plumbiphila]BBP03050.1 ubiquinol-cytochrome c reductase iron-sulfur subunit [Sulfuriferula plumbiphila]GEP31029.1 ubiquinol-cytochrome c reductase iron-sulfur subunit [Sulfuriferula plumbiphila]
MAATPEIDMNRRRFLIAATAAVGGAGFVMTAYPFVMSMMPSQKALAEGGPIDADIRPIEPGMLVTFAWRKQPVWVLHRTQAMLDRLGKHDQLLLDPLSQQPQQPVYCQNATRSIKPEYFVAIGICTHLGCIPTYRREVGAPDLGANWPGGFFCPCHGSKYDLAGRVFKDVPAPLNLKIPEHTYLSATRLLIGADKKAS